MDPHSLLTRHRAARTLEALAAVQKAFRTVVTTPNAHTPGRSGQLNVMTARAREHPRTITIGADEAHLLLRTSTPRNYLKAERKAHHELQEALALAMTRLGEITTPTPTPDALAAARLAHRKLARWIEKHERRAASHPVSRRLLLAHENESSHSVPPPATRQKLPAAPASDARAALDAAYAATKAENSRRRRHFLAIRAASRARAEAVASAPAGADAPDVVALALIPATPPPPPAKEPEPCSTTATPQPRAARRR